MKLNINVLLFICYFQRIQKIFSFFIISMRVNKVDDCIRRIELEEGVIFYEKSGSECSSLQNYNYNVHINNPLPYEIGQNIKYVVEDSGNYGGGCGLNMDMFLNDNVIKNDDIKFWKCDNCFNFSFDYNDNFFQCYIAKTHTGANSYNFYFNINSINDLDFQTSEYFYYLNNINNINITPLDFNNPINLIDLYLIDNLYAKNSEGNIITPFYKYIYYKLSFDEFKTHKGKFIGSDDSNIDIELNENSYSRIFDNKNLRYELSDEEKNNGGAYIRLKIGIYNNQKKLISNKLQNYNFFICLKEYQTCDSGTLEKCSCNLNEIIIDKNYLNEKSYIKLKVKGIGINRIFYSKDNKELITDFIPPDEVIINNKKKSYVFYEYEFENDINNVILIWNQLIGNLRLAFYGCSNITEVDLSHYDSPSLNNIGRLFQYCSSLTYVNFTNFNTEHVQYMFNMFQRCISLKSLDLSNFNTRSVIEMKYMFDNCKNLHYLNLKNFEENDNLDYNNLNIYKNIFRGISNDIKVCINKTKAPYLYQLIKDLNNSYIDCSDDWFINNNIFNYSYITIKIKGKGIKRIFYGRNFEEFCSPFKPPDEVLINNIKQKYVHYEYNFEQDENKVKLIWYNKIKTLQCCFYGCSKIIFADLTHVNSSNIEAMGNMFNGCQSLIYANFTNFDTSNCKAIHFMFKGCSSLVSLDLSSFNTKKVENIWNMFNGCNNLQYINLKKL